VRRTCGGGGDLGRFGRTSCGLGSGTGASKGGIGSRGGGSYLGSCSSRISRSGISSISGATLTGISTGAIPGGGGGASSPGLPLPVGDWGWGSELERKHTRTVFGHGWRALVAVRALGFEVLGMGFRDGE
jgi:hypothetical protein